MTSRPGRGLPSYCEPPETSFRIYQSLINDPQSETRKLDGRAVHAEAIALYGERTAIR